MADLILEVVESIQYDYLRMNFYMLRARLQMLAFLPWSESDTM